MALNNNLEVETKPGAGKRELATNFKRQADIKDRETELLARSGKYDKAVKTDHEAESLRWKSRGYFVLGAIETVAAKIGLNVEFKL